MFNYIKKQKRFQSIILFYFYFLDKIVHFNIIDTNIEIHLRYRKKKEKRKKTHRFRNFNRSSFPHKREKEREKVRFGILERYCNGFCVIYYFKPHILSHVSEM